MRLTSIRAKNFKSFKELDIRLDNLNVLIGANASGKSNFVQLFKFVRDVAEKGLDNAVSLQGGPRYLWNVNCGEGDKLTIELAVEDAAPLIFRSSPIAISRYLYRFSLARREERHVAVVEDELRLEGSVGFTIKRTKGEYRTEGDAGEFGSLLLASLPRSLFENSGQPAVMIQYLPWLAGLKSIAVYDVEPKAPKTGVLEGLSDLEPDANNLAIVLDRILSDEESRRKMLNLLKDMLPFVKALDTEVLRDKSLHFNMEERFSQQAMPAAFLSDGTIDVIALIVILYFERKSLVIIEEPEKNLHPSLMSGLVAFLKDASRKKQIAITTHNPELVRFVEHSELILISRDPDGFSGAQRPADKEQVQRFLREELTMQELFVENLLEV
jgi:predicted ATPase